MFDLAAIHSRHKTKPHTDTRYMPLDGLLFASQLNLKGWQVPDRSVRQWLYRACTVVRMSDPHLGAPGGSPSKGSKAMMAAPRGCKGAI